MNDNLIINRVSILRKGLEPKTYLLPSITDILTNGSIKKDHIDWLSVKLYLDGLYESKTAHDADINSINSRLITLSIDNEGNLEYSGYKFLNVTNYNPTSTEGLANRVTTLEGSVSSILENINTINTTIQGLSSIYANKNHTHAFSDLTGISEESGYLSIGDNEDKFIEVLSDKLIELNALATEGGNVYITPKVRNGEKAILVAEPNENKKFVKWTYNNLDISTNAIHILDTPLSGAAYIGVFTEADSDEPIQPTQYTLTINQPSHGSIVATANGESLSYGTTSLTLGTLVHIEAAASTGYKFSGWTGVPAGKENLTTVEFAISENTSISANFAAITPAHTIKVYFGEVINNVWTKFGDSVIVRYISQQLLTNPYEVEELVNLDGRELSVEGYKFVQWEEDDHIAIEENVLNRSTTSEDLTFYGTFAKLINILVVTDNSTAGTVSGGGTYLNGATVNISATANEGYHFVKWSDNNTLNPRTITVNSNTTTYTAIFAVNTYSVSTSVSPSSSGSISGLNSPYNWNTTCSITATPATGYNFVNWTEGGQTVSSNATYEFVVKADHTLVAVFAKKSYEITTTATSGGSASPATQTVQHGDSVTVTASPNTGYSFTKWTKGTSTTAVSTNASYTFNATEAVTLKANFELTKYTVSASVDPTGSGTVTVGGTANSKSISHGSTTTLVATANSGYEFVNWTLNGTQVATTASYTTPVITAAASYVAHFAEVAPVDNTIYYFASENDDYSPTGKTVKTLGDNNTTEQLNDVDTLVFLVPTTITITKIEDAQMGTDFFNKFQTHAVTYNSQEYTAYYYTDPDAYINGQFIVRL